MTTRKELRQQALDQVARLEEGMRLVRRIEIALEDLADNYRKDGLKARAEEVELRLRKLNYHSAGLSTAVFRLKKTLS